MFLCDLTDFPNRLNNTNFIIGIHNSNKDGLWSDGCFQFSEIDQAIFLNWQISYLTAKLFNMLTGIKNCFMFGINGDDMVTLARIHFKYTLDCKVIGFSRP